MRNHSGNGYLRAEIWSHGIYYPVGLCLWHVAAVTARIMFHSKDEGPALVSKLADVLKVHLVLLGLDMGLRLAFLTMQDRRRYASRQVLGYATLLTAGFLQSKLVEKASQDWIYFFHRRPVYLVKLFDLSTSFGS